MPENYNVHSFVSPLKNTKLQNFFFFGLGKCHPVIPGENACIDSGQQWFILA
jgi:hypothetical protein